MGGVASQRQHAPDIDLPTDFSLERALRHASNPALTAVRYHDSRTAHGRKLADDFERPAVDEVLGKGTYFEVVSIRGRTTGRRYALKTFSKKATPEDLLGLMASELEIFTGLDHPHIARAEGVYETEEDIYLVMECCEGGELFDRLAAQGPLTEADAADAIRQILRAVGYLHARGVAHRDLKLENILYVGKDWSSPLKLVDFGLSWACEPGGPAMERCCGSLEYVAPEVLGKEGYTSRCDMWSVGVVAFMLLTGRPPFPPGKGQGARIQCGFVDWGGANEWSGLSDEAVDFVRRCLVTRPEQRLDAQQAIFHPWLLRTLGNHAGVPALDAEVLRSIGSYAAAPRARRLGLQLAAQHLAPEETAGLRKAFLGLDLDNDGAIPVANLRGALREKLANDPGLESLLRGVELLKDGDSVCYSEFLAAAMGGASREAAFAVFRRLDARGRGTIDAEDLEDAYTGEYFKEIEKICALRSSVPDGNPVCNL